MAIEIRQRFFYFGRKDNIFLHNYQNHFIVKFEQFYESKCYKDK